MTTPKPYTLETREIGYLTPETVLVAYMPREDYINLVNLTIDQVTEDPDKRTRLHEIVDATAATQDRFAVGTWINEQRGCGCLVGETLIAGQHVEFLDEADFDPKIAARKQAVDVWTRAPSLEAVLSTIYTAEEADLLYNLGIEIDENIQIALNEHIDSISSEGYTETGEYVRSVIFI